MALLPGEYLSISVKTLYYGRKYHARIFTGTFRGRNRCRYSTGVNIVTVVQLYCKTFKWLLNLVQAAASPTPAPFMTMSLSWRQHSKCRYSPSMENFIVGPELFSKVIQYLSLRF